MVIHSFPSLNPVPTHVAVIMDGNRRWAQQRGLPAVMGHASGARRVRGLVQACAAQGVRYLTLFAFSTENWKRPQDEVSGLMGLFMLYLQKEVHDMNQLGVRLKVIGNLSGFEPRIQALVQDAQERTQHNDAITLTIAANYGGRWDLLQAMRAWQVDHPGEPIDESDESALHPYLSTAYAPEPDLLIRTGGEARISNFMLWQLAYSELYFTSVLWPDFGEGELQRAIDSYALRDRRFGGGSADKPARARDDLRESRSV